MDTATPQFLRLWLREHQGRWPRKAEQVSMLVICKIVSQRHQLHKEALNDGGISRHINVEEEKSHVLDKELQINDDF